jgi:aspartate oxidase
MSKNCKIIHQWFNGMEKFTFPFDRQKIPKNGIYILFEKGEIAHSGDRIVRIGTHTGKNQLLSRLNQHFLKENKDRSILRKNIGRALLNKDKDPFLEK